MLGRRCLVVNLRRRSWPAERLQVLPIRWHIHSRALASSKRSGCTPCRALRQLPQVQTMTTTTTTADTQAAREAEFVQLLAQVTPDDFAEVLRELEAMAALGETDAIRG